VCNLTVLPQDISNIVATFSPTDFVTLSVKTEGLGQGHVEIDGTPICRGGTCFTVLPPSTTLNLTAVAAGGSSFEGWTTGGCTTPSAATCVVSPTGDTTLTVRFTDDTVAPASASTAVLPGAQSGHIDGEDITAFMTSISDGPAQSCHVDNGGSDVALSYDLIGSEGAPRGLLNQVFDVGTEGRVDLVLSFASSSAVALGTSTIFPRLVCENATAAAIEDVNSFRLTMDDTPGPDILAIGVTPSGDGVIRIANPGSTSFMAAAALNIGQPTDGIVRVVADTGSARFPIELSLCETDTDGQCLGPRAPELETNFADNSPRYIGVFVRSDAQQGIPLDPANARVYLRFIDAAGVTRSTTSAAVYSPHPVDFATQMSPSGSWSVLVRQSDTDWPNFERGHIVIGEHGLAILDDGRNVSLVHTAVGTSQNGQQIIASGELTGSLFADGRIRVGNPFMGDAGFWGVLNVNSGHGNGLEIPSIDHVAFGPNSDIGGCLTDLNLGELGQSLFALSLSACEMAGQYKAAFVPSADGAGWDLLFANSIQGWRISE